MSHPAPATEPSARLFSLDALRGFDMFWILGADAVVHALGKISDAAPVRFLVHQMDHAVWDGFRFYDLIFPLFIFITGVSLTFSLSKTIEQAGAAVAAKRVLVRAGLLFLLGMLYNGGFAHAWPDVRLLGVLQRIALAYAAAGLLFCFCKPRVRCATGVGLLALYWILLTFVPIRFVPLTKEYVAAKLGTETPGAAQVRYLYDATVPTITGRYDPGLNLASHLDYLYLPGAKYDVYWDPEGLLSTLPAISSCLLGVMAGCWLRRGDWSEKQKLRRLLIAGPLCLLIGFAWGTQFPVIKKIWTSSFVLVAGGWSLLLLAAFYYIIDVRKFRGWCQPFVWIGLNPITLYLATSLLSFWDIAERLAGGSIALWLDRHVAAGMGRLILALVSLGLVLLLARFLSRRQIFLRV